MTIYNFTLLNVPFASGAPSSEIAPFSDFIRGLGIAFDETEGKPEMKGLNGLFNMITTSALYLKQRGICEWDKDLEYPIGAFVTDSNKLYKAKRQNLNKQPSLSQADWDMLAFVSDISVSTNGNLKKTTNTDGTVLLEVPTASTEQRGAIRFANSTEVVNKTNVNAAIRPSDVVAMFDGDRSATGWEILPSGLTLQWGIVEITGNKITSFLFPKPFSEICFLVTTTVAVPASGYTHSEATGRSGFRVESFGFPSNLPQRTQWFAIGK